jgi:hypothetical protein
MASLWGIENATGILYSRQMGQRTLTWQARDSNDAIATVVICFVVVAADRIVLLVYNVDDN